MKKRGPPTKDDAKDPKAAIRKQRQRDSERWARDKLRRLKALDEGLTRDQLTIEILNEVYGDLMMGAFARKPGCDEKIDLPRFLIRELKLDKRIAELKLTTRDEIEQFIEGELERFRNHLSVTI
jgi:hypothetical protein